LYCRELPESDVELDKTESSQHIVSQSEDFRKEDTALQRSSGGVARLLRRPRGYCSQERASSTAGGGWRRIFTSQPASIQGTSTSFPSSRWRARTICSVEFASSSPCVAVKEGERGRSRTRDCRHCGDDEGAQIATQRRRLPREVHRECLQMNPPQRVARSRGAIVAPHFKSGAHICRARTRDRTRGSVMWHRVGRARFSRPSSSASGSAFQSAVEHQLASR
jgi:hypothetical protein